MEILNEILKVFVITIYYNIIGKIRMKSASFLALTGVTAVV